jgi:hypothetical protein
VTDLAPVGRRLWAILDPYRDRLVPGSVYGLDTLTRPGAKAHGYFAGVRVADRHVAFHLMPIYRDPSLLDGISPVLRRHLKGKSTFNFTEVDEELFAGLESLVGRAYEAYGAGG